MIRLKANSEFRQITLNQMLDVLDGHWKDMHKQNYLVSDNAFNHHYRMQQLANIGFVRDLENIIISLWICERNHRMLLNEQEIFITRQQDIIILKSQNNLINIALNFSFNENYFEKPVRSFNETNQNDIELERIYQEINQHMNDLFINIFLMTHLIPWTNDYISLLVLSQQNFNLWTIIIRQNELIAEILNLQQTLDTFCNSL